VYLPPLGDRPHSQFSTDYYSAVVGMMSARMQARRLVASGLPPEMFQGGADPRSVALEVGRRGVRAAFLLDADLFTAVRQATYETHEELTHDALARIAVASTVSAVRPDFTADAITGRLLQPALDLRA
jgi:hypothetical protein